MGLSDLTAAILVGGTGSRLRAVVSDRPKPMADVEGRPFLGYLLDWLQTSGIRRCVLCTGYMGDLIERELGTRHGEMSLHYSREPQALGTGGAVRLALPYLQAQTLILNGDSFFDLPLDAFLHAHLGRRAAASLALCWKQDTSRYGRVEVDEAQRVRAFIEKQAVGGPGYINGGVYLATYAFIRDIPDERPVSLEREVFPARLDEGVYGYTASGAFIDIGTPESYARAPAFFKGG